MKRFLTLMSGWFEALPDRISARRWQTWLLFVVVVGAMAPGAARFELDLTDEDFFNKGDPIRQSLDRFRAQFGSDDPMMVIYQPKDGDLFSPATLKAVRGIQEDLLNYRLHLKAGETSPLDHIVDVTSLDNVSYLESSEDALISRQFIGGNYPQSKTQQEVLRRQALNHPDYPLAYLSRDGQYGSILIRTDFGAKLKTEAAQVMQDESAMLELDAAVMDIDIADVTSQATIAPQDQAIPEFESADAVAYADFTNAVYAILNKAEYKQALEYYPVGNPVINHFVMETLFKQANVVMLLAVLLVIAALWILFRSAAATIWPTVIILVSSVLTVATLGWLGLRMNMMINITILLVLVVGVADSVHILSGYLYFRNQGKDHRAALRAAYRQAGMAVLLTSLTTAIGMLALLMVPIKAINIFGFSAALGVIFAFFISVFMLPVMLDLWSPFSKKRAQAVEQGEHKPHLIQRLLQQVEHLSHLRPALNVSLFTVLMVVFAYGTVHIEVDSNPMALFEQESKIVKDFDIVDKRLGGTTGLEIMIDMGTENALKDPQVLKVMEKLQQDILQQLPDEITRAHSLVNIVKDASKSLNGGRTEAYRIPDDQRVVEQTLFLFNNANPGDRRKVVSDDYRQAHISLSSRNVGSKRYMEIINKVQPQIDDAFAPLKAVYPNMQVTLTGSMSLFAKLLDTLSWSQIKGFAVALSVISLLMLLVFGSLRMGLVSLYPNIFPLVVMFGLMGYLGIPLDVDTLIVAPLMIGIVVDDTIHFLNHYRGEMASHGDVERAIRVAFREVGQAITFTSIILALSFTAMMLLDHQGLKHFGQLSAITVMTALMAELFLLPSLLVLTRAGSRSYRIAQNAQAEGAKA